MWAITFFEYLKFTCPTSPRDIRGIQGGAGSDGLGVHNLGIMLIYQSYPNQLRSGNILIVLEKGVLPNLLEKRLYILFCQTTSIILKYSVKRIFSSQYSLRNTILNNVKQILY